MPIPPWAAMIAARTAGLLCRDEQGATAVEYGIIVMLICVVIVGALALFGSTITGMFNSVITAL